MALFTNGKSWPAVTFTLTANGGANGVLTVASTNGLHVGQRVILRDTIGTPFLTLYVIEVLSATTFTVGLTLVNATNCSAFTTANGSTVITITEGKNITEASHVLEAAYDPSPGNCLRVQTVDSQGNYVDASGAATPPGPPPLTSLTEIAPQYATLGFAAITGTSAGTANTIITLNADRSILQVLNSLNTDVSLTYNGVEYWRLEANDSFIVDFRSNGLKVVSGRIIGIFYNTVPTAGTIRVTVI